MKVPCFIETDATAVELFNVLAEQLGDRVDDSHSYLMALHASVQADLQRTTAELDVEGPLLTRPSGVKVANPKVRYLGALRKQLASLSKSLRLVPKNGKTRNVGGGLRQVLGLG